MPSWNIHTAHVERALAEAGDALGIADKNAFLVGNLLPDTYVGYMVPNITHRIDYKLTHHALRAHIPLPDYDQFWNFYVLGDMRGRPSDLVLGAWAHLVCDRVYNRHTKQWLAERGLPEDERARVGKQGDFALYGRTLGISMVPEVNESLLRQCAEFPPYSVDEADVRATAESAARIVADNQTNFIEGVPEYQMLTPDFFESAGNKANQIIVQTLTELAATR